MLKFIGMKLDGLSYRLLLLHELQILRSKGRYIPVDARRLVWKAPQRWDDFIEFLCFFDNNHAVNLIDVGANVGRFSSDFRQFFPKSDFIVCIEPNPALRPLIEKSLSGVPNVTIVGVGVGDEPGSLTLQVPEDGAGSALGSFLTFNEAANEFYKTAKMDSVDVPIDTLDNLVGERSGPTIVKIDTQGFEVKVVRGGTNVLSRADAVLLECSFAPMHQGASPTFNACAGFLAELGFVPVSFQRYGNKISTYAFERDVLFVKEKLTPRLFYKNY